MAPTQVVPSQSVNRGIQVATSLFSRFSLPRPHSLGDFILYPSRWSVPPFKDPSKWLRRVKTNLLYFQTNYLILTLGLLALFTILSMKTLLTGLISALFIAVSILFFFEHLPLARQIKQNHPTLVIICGILLVILTWHSIHTILFLIMVALSPNLIWFLHASMRSSDNLVDATSLVGNYFANTPAGQLMQMFGIEPRASLRE